MEIRLESKSSGAARARVGDQAGEREHLVELE
jgi:hypothetical protein